MQHCSCTGSRSSEIRGKQQCLAARFWSRQPRTKGLEAEGMVEDRLLGTRAGRGSIPSYSVQQITLTGELWYRASTAPYRVFQHLFALGLIDCQGENWGGGMSGWQVVCPGRCDLHQNANLFFTFQNTPFVSSDFHQLKSWKSIGNQEAYREERGNHLPLPINPPPQP